MKNFDFRKYRNAAASFGAKTWRSIISWPGWKKIFTLPINLVLLLSITCAAGLVWVFRNGLETWVPSYFLYALSAYCLTALCAKLPASHALPHCTAAGSFAHSAVRQ